MTDFTFDLNETLKFTGTADHGGQDGAFTALKPILAEYVHGGGTMTVTLDGFDFNYSGTPSSMGLDLQAAVREADGGPAIGSGRRRFDPDSRFDPGRRRFSWSWQLPEGVYLVTFTARPVLYGGPPSSTPFIISGKVTLHLSSQTNRLSFVPDGEQLVGVADSVSLSVELGAETADDVTVGLSTRAGFLTVDPTDITVPAGSNSAGFTIRGTTGGYDRVIATSEGYRQSEIVVIVVPRILGLSPQSGTPGTVLTITGLGFAAGATVNFGTLPAIPGEVVDSGTITVSVPHGLPAGDVPVGVTVNGSSAFPLSFTVKLPAP